MSKPPSANFAREMENVVADICHAYGVTRDVVKGLCEELANLKAENATLRSLAAAMAEEMEQHGGEQAFDSLALYRAALAKEAKS